MLKRTIALAIASLILLVMYGCGGSGRLDDGAPAADSPRELANFLRKTVSYDYDPYNSPEAMRQDAHFAGLGSVRSVDAAVISGAPEALGGVIVSIEVEEAWKVDAPEATGSVVHFLLRRPSNIGVEMYQNSLPVGSKVALFAHMSKLPLAEGKPPGVVYEPAPQGLILEGEEGQAINVWGADENADLDKWSGATSIRGIRAALRLRGIGHSGG